MIRRWLLTFIILALPASLAAATAGTITVVAEQDGNVLQALIDHSTVIKQVDYIGLDASSEPVTTAIHFSGTAATPLATVLVTIPDAMVSESITVDANGQWDVVVPTKVLTGGNYYAYVAAADEEGAGMGETKPVAYFNVQADQNLSTTTWIFLLTSGLTIFALLLAITLQLRYNSAHHTVL